MNEQEDKVVRRFAPSLRAGRSRLMNAVRQQKPYAVPVRRTYNKTHQRIAQARLADCTTGHRDSRNRARRRQRTAFSTLSRPAAKPQSVRARHISCSAQRLRSERESNGEKRQERLLALSAREPKPSREASRPQHQAKRERHVTRRSANLCSRALESERGAPPRAFPVSRPPLQPDSPVCPRSSRRTSMRRAPQGRLMRGWHAGNGSVNGPSCDTPNLSHARAGPSRSR